VELQRPWLSIYPKGVPANIDADAFPNLLAFFKDSVEKYSSRPAFTCLGKTITYQQLDKKSDRLAGYLQSRGLKPGDRIAIMMPNLLQYPIAIFGCLKAGLVIVNTNPLYTAREMLHQFRDSGVKGIIIADMFAANLEKILGETDINTIITTSIGELLNWPKGWIVNFVVKRIKKKVPKFQIPNDVSFKEALSQGRKFKINEFEDLPDRTILHQYTGGTTGVSKAAMLTNRNIVANMLQMKAVIHPFLDNPGEVCLCPLPLYHIFAFTVNCMAMISMGHHSVLVVNPRELKTVVKAFNKYPVGLVTGVNTLYNALNRFESFQNADFENLKICVAGGMALQRPVAERWKQITGILISEGYGLTETSPVVSVNPLDGNGRIGTIGLPVPSTDVRIVDKEGNPLPPGQQGELEVRGPQVMKGYYNRADETGIVSHDGWLRTGDIAVMYEDGYFAIVDRIKDMINVSGFNVFPNEIEEIVAQHKKVKEVAAIGIPHEKSGEVVKLFIVKEDDTLNEEEVIAFCRENMTGYKVPKEVEFRDDLPKTNVGKILRRKLRGN
jgi:long-chain acyl-CoA synthetase